jgi:ceramide glucosyltransferase
MLTTLLPFICILPPLVYGLITLACARSYFCRRRTEPGHTPPISILKPVKGMDADSFDNFASFCRQEYPASYQIIFAVADPADPVIPIIRCLMDEFPGVDIDLVVDAVIHGPNYKVSNLINAFPRAKHDILVVCDSDIRVSPDFLLEMAAPFADSKVGLVTSLYRSPGVRGAATAMEAMGFTTDMVPNVMVAMKLEGLSFALGAAMTVRREALGAIGGFPALADYLADDYQLGNKIHKAGWRLELSDCIVESVMPRENLATILSRQLRWSHTLRVSRPRGYLGWGITQPFPMACLALVASGFSGAGCGAILFLYLVRSAVALVFSRCYVKDGIFPRWLWLLPLRDLLAFATWVLSFAGNRVSWRGNLFRLMPGGRIVEI